MSRIEYIHCIYFILLLIHGFYFLQNKNKLTKSKFRSFGDFLFHIFKEGRFLRLPISRN